VVKRKSVHDELLSLADDYFTRLAKVYNNEAPKDHYLRSRFNEQLVIARIRLAQCFTYRVYWALVLGTL
jgi:hypothetical protein